jgi:hypothetical protein
VNFFFFFSLVDLILSMESPVGGSSVSERSAVGRSRTPQHASSSSLASPSQASDGDVGQPDVAGSTSPSTARRFPGLELERGMRGVDVGPRSAYRHHVAGTTLPPPVDVALHESSELLAQWAHLVPDEAFEKYLQMDDLDSLLFGCSGVVDQCPHEFANSLGSELTPETSETPSGHELGSTPRLSGPLGRGNAERGLVIVSNIPCKHSLQNVPS